MCDDEWPLPGGQSAKQYTMSGLIFPDASDERDAMLSRRCDRCQRRVFVTVGFARSSSWWGLGMCPLCGHVGEAVSQ